MLAGLVASKEVKLNENHNEGERTDEYIYDAWEVENQRNVASIGSSRMATVSNFKFHNLCKIVGPSAIIGVSRYFDSMLHYSRVTASVTNLALGDQLWIPQVDFDAAADEMTCPNNRHFDKFKSRLEN